MGFTSSLRGGGIPCCPLVWVYEWGWPPCLLVCCCFLIVLLYFFCYSRLSVGFVFSSFVEEIGIKQHSQIAMSCMLHFQDFLRGRELLPASVLAPPRSLLHLSCPLSAPLLQSLLCKPRRAGTSGPFQCPRFTILFPCSASEERPFFFSCLLFLPACSLWPGAVALVPPPRLGWEDAGAPGLRTWQAPRGPISRLLLPAPLQLACTQHLVSLSLSCTSSDHWIWFFRIRCLLGTVNIKILFYDVLFY